ncbi:Phage integrase family protein [Tranquillimonas rosea]|uniref:Phage integrase family protein n=1 Tax=Tranquillimonas rosea TaxID=641238 RepID=A0A1H9VJU0_9RHOB|nr:tyrosine-type recombinase/integrase [Tranquillimonas rosea]SES21808.1 Phage integrase family protein [Tranquillimonas rosea]
MTTTSNKKKPKKPKIKRERLKWVWPRNGSGWVPYHRVTWTDSSGKRKERSIKLDWQGDLEKLDTEYWAAEAGRHPAQRKPIKHTWGECIREWQGDAKKQMNLSSGTKKSYSREFNKILEKNAEKRMSSTSKAAIRKKHNAMSATPRAADWMLQVVSILWNYANDTLDWNLGENPTRGIEKYGPQREFPTWPNWLLEEVEFAPDDVRIAAELIQGTGQRPSAAIQTPRSALQDEWITVVDEKGDSTFDIYCPERLRVLIENLPPGKRHVLAKNELEHLSYDDVEKAFRAWRASLSDRANENDDDITRYSLHGLRKRACVELAEAGCSDSEIQAVTGQSLQTVAKYRREADRKKLSRSAQKRRAEH